MLFRLIPLPAKRRLLRYKYNSLTLVWAIFLFREKEKKPKSTNMLPAILTLIVLDCGGGFFVFKKVQKKKKQEAAKPDPDADYVDDDEDYWYDPEFEDNDADSSVDEDDNEPL